MISSKSRCTVRKGVLSEEIVYFVSNFLSWPKRVNTLTEHSVSLSSFQPWLLLSIVDIVEAFLPVPCSMSKGEGRMYFLKSQLKKVFKYSKVFDTFKMYRE